MTAHIKMDSCQPITINLNIIYTQNKDSAADHYCFKKSTLDEREKKKIFLMNNFHSQLNVTLNLNFTESYFSLFFQAA